MAQEQKHENQGSREGAAHDLRDCRLPKVDAVEVSTTSTPLHDYGDAYKARANHAKEH